MKERSGDLPKVYDFFEERKKRNIGKEIVKQRENNVGLMDVIDLPVERTLRGLCDDEMALKENWDKRCIDSLIVDGSYLPRYEQLVSLMEDGQFEITSFNPLARELISKGPMFLRLNDGSLVRLAYPSSEVDFYQLESDDFEE